MTVETPIAKKTKERQKKTGSPELGRCGAFLDAAEARRRPPERFSRHPGRSRPLGPRPRRRRHHPRSRRVSDRPADESTPYGHGKVENFSALIETVLLFVTCAWIIYEAVHRIFFRRSTSIPSLWAFLVVIVFHRRRCQPVPDARPAAQQTPEPGPRGRRSPFLDRRLELVGGRPRRPGPRLAREEGPSRARRPPRPGRRRWPPSASPSSSSSSATGSGKRTIDVLLDRAPGGPDPEDSARPRPRSRAS